MFYTHANGEKDKNILISDGNGTCGPLPELRGLVVLVSCAVKQGLCLLCGDHNQLLPLC